jgi:GMP synthase (glutamine-hydrolysing)
VRVLFVQHQQDCPPGWVGERLADLGADVEVLPARSSRYPDPAGFQLVVPLGSDDSAADDSVSYLRREWELLERAVQRRVPVFGICFGAQLLCRVLGGAVRPLPEPEIGWLPVRTDEPGLVEPGPWLVWHLDRLDPAPGSVPVARTGVATQAFTHGPHLGVQFHPEATPASIGVWAQRYRGSLARIGIEPDGLVAESHDRSARARELADRLVDRVLARADVAA